MQWYIIKFPQCQNLYQNFALEYTQRSSSNSHEKNIKWLEKQTGKYVVFWEGIDLGGGLAPYYVPYSG